MTTALRASQCQQLVHGARRAHTGTADLLERLLQLDLARLRAQGQFRLHAQTRQWGFELVRCISQKAALGNEGLTLALKQVID